MIQISNITNLSDGKATMQLFGCLMKNPLLFAEIDKYKLTPNDFETKFLKIVFSSIFNIYADGAKVVSVIDISSYLDSHLDLKQIFEKENGIDFLQDCEEVGELDNFSYYYLRVKKFSLLRALQKEGFDISDFFSDNPLETNYQKKIEKFDSLSITDIFEEVKKKLYTLEEDYNSSSNSGSCCAAEGMRDLKEQFKKVPEIGLPLQGEIWNTAVRGARRGKYYLRSAQSGAGKTRLMVGDACGLSIPVFYDVFLNQWVDKGFKEKSLIITTELSSDEIQTMILSHVSGVNEEKILYGSYTFEEEERVNKAIKIIEDYKDYLILEQMPDPNIAQIEAVVRKQCLVNGIQNVFYDYIFSSPSLLREFSGLKIREDERNVTSSYIPFLLISRVINLWLTRKP